MNVLIYSPSNLRAADQQAQAELLISLGHKVFLLTWAAPGILHKNFEALGAISYSSYHVKGKSIIFFAKQAKYLASFCKKYQIDVVFSHLQSNAIAAGLAKYFVQSKFYYMRHNADYFSLNASAKSTTLNKMANFLSSDILAISNNVKNELLKEGVNEKRIHRINLCYNFKHYETERLYNSEAIRKEFNAETLIIYTARLDPLKRHLMAFEVIKQLVNEGINLKLVCIGEGPKREKLEGWISANAMGNNIILKGFVSNVFDYLVAADLLLLLSYSEASSHATKEAGLCNKPVIVCNGVGDFGDYITHNENGYLVDKENPVQETVTILRHLIKNKEELIVTGANLRNTIEENFGMKNVKEQYHKLLT